MFLTKGRKNMPIILSNLLIGKYYYKYYDQTLLKKPKTRGKKLFSRTWSKFSNSLKTYFQELGNIILKYKMKL